MKTINEIINEAKASDLAIKGLNVKELIEMLKDAFAEEMNAWYQYYIIAPFLVGNERTNIMRDYEENSYQEMSHASRLLERINQLDGDYSGLETPDIWNKIATHKFIVPNGVDVETSLNQMAEAEKGAIETYTKLEEFTRDKDIVTHDIVKNILAEEQKHLQEMEEFLNDIK